MSIIKVHDREKAEELVRLAFGEHHKLDVYLGNMTDEEFTLSRRGKVGGSDMSTIFGGTKNTWVYNGALDMAECHETLAYEVYGKHIIKKAAKKPKITLMRKLRYPDLWTKEEVDEATQKIFDLGHINEPKIAELYEEQTGDIVYEFPWRILYDALPYGIKDIDYLCQDKDTGEFYVLEIKNPQAWTTQKGWRIIAAKGCTDDLDYLVDECYRMQVWFYLSGTNMTYAKVCAGGWSLNEIGYTRVERLPENAEAKMVDSTNRTVEKMKNPRIRISEIDFPDKRAILKEYCDTFKKVPLSNMVIQLPTDCEKKVAEYIRLSKEVESRKKLYLDAIKEIKKQLGIGKTDKEWTGPLMDRFLSVQASLAEVMSDHRIGTITFSNGEVHRIRYEYKMSDSFDKKEFGKQYPELLDKYTIRKKKTRVLKIE